MTPGKHIKLTREGEYMAEVEVARIGEPAGWEPYLSVEDATKLDRIQAALKAGDTTSAAQLGKVYRVIRLGAE